MPDEILRGHAFTAGLSDRHVAKLASLAREVAFEENDLILLAGQQSKHFYLLLSGSVCIEAGSRVCTVCIQAIGPGEAFGWSSLLDYHDTLFQVRAREQSTALCLDGARLSAVFQEDTALAANLLRRALALVAGRVQATEAKLGELCGMRMQKNV
jgi:CRP-like cAMP-binding protein